MDSHNFMFVRSDRRMLKIAFNEIIYIESYSDYIKIQLYNKTKVITRENISSIEVKITKRKFIRSHRSYIIAVNYIESFTNEKIVIFEKSLHISRS